MELLVPVVAVTVHPQLARVTRRGRLPVPAGTTEVVVAGLPMSLLEESVRVTGRSDQPVRIVGVDVAYRDLADAPDDRVRAAEAAVRNAERALGAVEADDAADAAREEMVQRLARRAGDRLAVALAEGAAGASRVAEVGAAVSDQLVQIAASRRTHAERRADARRVAAAAQAEMDRLRSSGRERREAVVGVEADAEGEVELELTYVVYGASWSPAYDARLGEDGEVALTWFGMVAQATGEDWPSCELTLSTARPAVSTLVPELDPWWVDVRRPQVVARAAPATAGPSPVALSMAASGRGRGATEAGGADDQQREVLEALAIQAQVVEGTVAASWRLGRPVAVPGDGTPHRTTVAAFGLPARLDHVTAPALSLDAHLRATITNTTGQVLLAGPVSTYLADAFVGSTRIEQTAPDAEIELALGVDDRIVVERELQERAPHRARFGSTRGATERWQITVTNRRPADARVTVRDRVPVSRNAEVKVVDVAVSPEPAERDDLGRLEWVARLAAGASWEASVRFGVEHGKEVPIVGWR